MKKKIYLLTFFYFLFGISVNLVHPITPDFVRYLNLSETYFGIFFSVMSIGIFVGSLFFGRLSDKIGRTVLLSIGLMCYGLFQFLFGFVTFSPLLIVMFRFFSGVSTSGPHTLFLSFVRDIETKENQGKAFSLMSMFYLLGNALGYKIGGYLFTSGIFNFHGVFLTQSLFCISLGLLFLMIFYKEGKNIHVLTKKYASFSSLKSLNSYLIIFFISFALITMSHTIVTKYIDSFVTARGYTSDDLGNMVLTSGIVGIISNFILLLIIRKSKKFSYGKGYLIFMSLSLLSITLTFTINQDHFIINMYTFYIVFIISKSIMLPLEQTLISNKFEGEAGVVMGIRQSFLAFGQFLGPLICAKVYEINNYYVFYFAMILIFVAMILLLVINIRERKKEA